MAGGAVSPIDHHYICVRVLDQGVYKAHPECPRADYEVMVSISEPGTSSRQLTRPKCSLPQVADQE